MVMLDIAIAILILILIMLVVLLSLMMFFFYREIIKQPISQRKIKSNEPEKVKQENEEKITLAGVEYDAKDLPNVFDEWLNGEKKEGN